MTSFSGDCRVTGIGSLPHTDPVVACDFVLGTADQIPYWPQLPKRDEREGMVDQFVRGLPGLRPGTTTVDMIPEAFPRQLESFYENILKDDLEPFGFEPYEASALFEMIRRGTDSGALGYENSSFIKGQITGPVTLCLQVVDEEKKFAIYNDQYRDVITRQLTMKGRWLLQRLRAINPSSDSIIFLDEPLLYTYGSAHYNFPREHVIQLLTDVLNGLDGIRGIHACSNCDWTLMLDANPDVLSFDAYSFAETFLIHKERVAEFMNRGGVVAWGIVPNHDELYLTETADTLTERLLDIYSILSESGISEAQLFKQSLITPACGVGSLQLEHAERIFSLCVGVSEKMRAKFL